MPNLFPFATHESEDAWNVQKMGAEVLQPPPGMHPRRSSLFKNWGRVWRRHHEHDATEPDGGQLQLTVSSCEPSQCEEYVPTRRPSLPNPLAAEAHPKAIPSLPRPQTFRRQESEKREKLLEVPPSPTERRTVSVDRRQGLSASAARRRSSPKPVPIPSLSAPDVVQKDEPPGLGIESVHDKDGGKQGKDGPELPPALRIPDQDDDCEIELNDEDEEGEIDQNSLQEEYDRRWILNLSMQFRDGSKREKFFVTYAETPTKWRRLTISLDYRDAPEGSLEADLSTLHYQRDKSVRIYEAIRESLPDIQYYNTVTNLKLETTPSDCQLHVHVREDANEIIQYPSTSIFDHVRARRYAESEVEFLTHLSGFVYKVRLLDEERNVIKKEIPGPDTVDEFLYEVNALDSLLGCRNVVQLEGLVTDEDGQVVKGLLISYASQGALVDMLYDLRNTPELPWHRREKWARQIVQGLSDIHEAGFVQGDFTLSNIVIDENDYAQIIDVNRRGCPVGWEPPELGRLIDSGQRISMCIGVKTDLFQLGMVLWAIAEEVDEPERVERPLPPMTDEIPAYYKRMVETCLSERPQGRSSAKRLLRQFPPTAGLPPPPGRQSMVDFVEDVMLSDHSVSTSHRSDKEYIDPNMAVTLEDVSERHRRRNTDTSHFTSGQVTYVTDAETRDPESNPASTSYRFESSGSWVVGRRGRSPLSNRRRRSSPFGRSPPSSATSLSRNPPSRSRRRYGSECSEPDEKVEDPPLPAPRNEETDEQPVVVPKAAELNERNSGAPTVEDTSEDGPQDTMGSSQAHVQDKRLAAIQGQRDCEKHTDLLHTDSRFEEPKETTGSLPVRDKRLAVVREHDQDYKQSPLLHTDSGFDEQMVEELELEPSEKVGESKFEPAEKVEEFQRDSAEKIEEVELYPPRRVAKVDGEDKRQKSRDREPQMVWTFT